MDESLLGPWNTYQREQEGDVRGEEEEGGCTLRERMVRRAKRDKEREKNEQRKKSRVCGWHIRKKLFSKYTFLLLIHENVVLQLVRYN